jgi:hypothetical protein
MKFAALTLGFLLIASVALAADIDGKWSGQLPGMGGGEPMTLSYVFKADGTALTGTSIGPDGAPTPIKNGKIDGNNISFQVSIDFGGNEMTFKYKGVLSGDSIKLSMDMGMGDPQEFSIKKAK